jgi:transposase
MEDPRRFFLEPVLPSHRQYEALRAYFVDQVPAGQVARRFKYSPSTFYALLRDLRDDRLPPFFTARKRGPKEAPLRESVFPQVVELRKQNRSATEIASVLKERGLRISAAYVIRILKQEGFARLPKRSRLEIERPAKVLPVEDEVADVRRLALQEGRSYETQYGGLFLLLPILAEMGLVEAFAKAGFPGSKMIPPGNWLLSFLALKVMDKARHSHTMDMTFDRGPALFAGLNSLPKTTPLTDYSYRLAPENLERFRAHVVSILKEQGRIRGHSINLDFHPIPHWGDQSVLEEQWIATRGKAIKGALTFFAQDQETTYLCYVQADIRRKEAAEEIVRFCEFWKATTGIYPERLIFDSALTSYQHLQWLDERGIVFITLQRRPRRLLEMVDQIPKAKFRTVRIQKVKRKYQRPKVYEERIHLPGVEKSIRRMIVTNLGREEPMLLITNDRKGRAGSLLTEYSQRWRIENSLAEQVDFFHLNALGSPLQIAVAFDALMTFTAHTVMKQFARRLRGYEHCTARTLYREFLRTHATVAVRDNQLHVGFERRRNNPLLRAARFDQPKQPIPWLGRRTLQLTFR